jgi:hypothetical protein
MPQYVALLDKWELAADLPKQQFDPELSPDAKYLPIAAFMNGADEEEANHEKQ